MARRGHQESGHASLVYGAISSSPTVGGQGLCGRPCRARVLVRHPPAPRHGSSRGLVWLRSSNRKRPVTLFPICPQHSVSLGGSPSGPPGGAVATAWLRGVGGWGREGRRPDVASLPPLCPAAGCTGLRRASRLVWPGLGRPKAMPRDGGQSRHTSSCTEDSTKRSIELTSIFFLTPRSWLFSWSCQNECLSSFGTSENRLCFSAACFQ